MAEGWIGEIEGMGMKAWTILGFIYTALQCLVVVGAGGALWCLGAPGVAVALAGAATLFAMNTIYLAATEYIAFLAAKRHAEKQVKQVMREYEVKIRNGADAAHTLNKLNIALRESGLLNVQITPDGTNYSVPRPNNVPTIL